MTKQKKIFAFAGTLFIIALVLNSCQNYSFQQSIDLSRNDVVSVFDLFEQVDVIPLETHPDAMVAFISRLEFFDGYYYILDMKTQQVFCFDGQGNFQFKISAQGRGPGEYSYATHFTIDGHKRQILLLDAIGQRILFFDLKGNFLSSLAIPANKPMGFGRSFLVNDSIILLTTTAREQFVFFDTKNNELTLPDSVFFSPAELMAFAPNFNVYQYNNRTYAMPALSREVYDVTGQQAVPYFQWCFGAHNNSQQQLNQLIEEKRSRSFSDRFVFQFEAVGKGKILDHSIIRVFETDRFLMAFLEYDDNYKHVFVDKKMGTHHVFNSFKEGVSLIFEQMQSDRVITFDKGIDAFLRERGIPELYKRTNETFNVEIFSAQGRDVYQNHEPLKENPFLVVYRFKE